VPHEEKGSRGFLVEAVHLHEIEGLSGVAAVVVGGTQSLALREDGTVIQWAAGDNVNAATRILGAPAGSRGLVTISGQPLTNAIAITASTIGDLGAFGPPATRINLALTRGRTVVAWDDAGISHSASTPAGLTNVIGISAGPDFFLAIALDEGGGR